MIYHRGALDDSGHYIAHARETVAGAHQWTQYNDGVASRVREGSHLLPIQKWVVFERNEITPFLTHIHNKYRWAGTGSWMWSRTSARRTSCCTPPWTAPRPRTRPRQQRRQVRCPCSVSPNPLVRGLDKLTTDISIYFTSLIKPTAATGGSQLPAPAAVAAAAAAASQGGGAGVGGAREEEQEEMGGRWEPAFSDDTGGDDEEAMEEEEEEEEEEDDTTREAGGDETSPVSGSIQGHALGDRWGEEDEEDEEDGSSSASSSDGSSDGGGRGGRAARGGGRDGGGSSTIDGRRRRRQLTEADELREYGQQMFQSRKSQGRARGAVEDIGDGIRPQGARLEALRAKRRGWGDGGGRSSDDGGVDGGGSGGGKGSGVGGSTSQSKRGRIRKKDAGEADSDDDSVISF